MRQATQRVIDDLFGPSVPGLRSINALVTPAEERRLIAQIDAAGLTPFRFQQWTGRRLTRSYGWSYDFARATFEPAEPIPDWLLPIRLRAAECAGLEAVAMCQALVIRYDPGAGIGWHRDRPVFGDVIGLSLGEPATLRLRRRFGTGFERVSLPLPARGVYHLTGEARWEWEHSIAPMEETRWSVTFRTLADRASGILLPRRIADTADKVRNLE